MSLTLYYPNLDTLIACYEARPVSAARTKAWEWLSLETRLTFNGAWLIVPSATWSSTDYSATPERCTCKAKGRCWHMEAAQIVADARAEDARYDTMAELDELRDRGLLAPSRKATYEASRAALMECFS